MLSIITHPMMLIILALFVLVIISPSIFKNKSVSDAEDDIKYDN